MKRFVIVLFVGLSVFIFSLITHNLLNSNQKAVLTVRFNNARDIRIYDVSESQDNVNAVLVGKIRQSGEALKLEKERSYLAIYTGISGYESGRIPFDTFNGNKTLSIEPFYSADKLSALLNSEFGVIQNTLATKYAKINLYNIEPGKLYHYGEWYGTKLTYRGEDLFNADTLVVILHKEKGRWVVVTDPPNISISKPAYPGIPSDILKDVNNFL